MGKRDIFGRLFALQHSDYIFQLWVGLNVNRVFVIYFVPLVNGLTLDRAKEIFAFTFGGAEKLGYHVNYEIAKLDTQDLLSIWLNVETADDLVSNPQDKLFWAQDVAMMTQSFLRTAHRNSISLHLAGTSPGPL